MARIDGTIWTEYWGHKKPHDEMTLITRCCKSEDYEELTADEYFELRGEWAKQGELLMPEEVREER